MLVKFSISEKCNYLPDNIFIIHNERVRFMHDQKTFHPLKLCTFDRYLAIIFPGNH